MRLRTLEADRLRNLRAANVDLDASLTVVVGRNGHGKSSLLEAIYLLATGRSFRTRAHEELVCWDGGPLRAEAEVRSRLGSIRLGAVIDGRDKRLLVEGAERELEDFLGRLDVVVLSHESMRVLRGGPDERRRFLDRGVAGIDPSHLRTIGEYRRVLSQRNELLKARSRRPGAAWRREIEAWDERLVRAAAGLHAARRTFAVRLASRLSGTGSVVFPSGGEVTAVYKPSPAAAGGEDPVRFPEIYERALDASRERDEALGFTGDGPHRDDLAVELDGVDLRRFGSAGQLRASVAALKLAKLRVLEHERGEPPVFLMDDFDSDLDEGRSRALVDHLREGGFQAVLATAKEEVADRLGVPFRKLRVTSGAVSAIEPS